MAERKARKALEVVPLQTFSGSKMEQLKQLYDQWYGCKRCQLSTFRLDADGTPGDDIVLGDGNPDAKIMIIGEAPGEEEQNSGVPFVGPSGRLLNQILSAVSDDVGIQELVRWYNTGRRAPSDTEHFHAEVFKWRQHEFYITNIVACRPPDNRLPTKPEIEACWERLYNLIYIVDPWFIITSGKAAIEALVRKVIEITKLRGSIFDVDLPGRVAPYKIPVMATLHPSFLLRTADWKLKNGMFMKTVKDFLAAMRFVDELAFRNLGTPIPRRPTFD